MNKIRKLSKGLVPLSILSILLSPLIYRTAYGQRARSRQKPESTPACTLELKDSPNIRGIQLGMTLEEFLKLFPSAKPLKNSRSEVGAMTYEVNQEENPNFANSSTKLRFVWFVDERLSSVGFYYPEYEPISIADFVRQVATSLKLPSVGWRNVDNLPNPKALKCSGFEVMVGREVFRAGIGDPYLILSDTLADAKVIERENNIKQKEAEERRRKERERHIFRP